jgi:hypothetical protein
MSSRVNTKIGSWRHKSQVLDRRMNQKTLTDFM